MNDLDFTKLKLRNHIAPTQARWPEPTIVHWIKLHAAADTARSAAEFALAKIADIEKDGDLCPEGKRRKKAAVAAEAIADLQENKSLGIAKSAVETQLQKWSEKAGTLIKKPADMHEASVHTEIRQHVAALKDTERRAFIERHGADLNVLSALLTAPSFLSNLSEAELAHARHKAESHLDPKIVEARAATAKALEDVERGWRTATRLIAEAGGLQRDIRSGDWVAAAA